jgi:glycerol-3-phosphate acyltransferase PlsY
MLGTFPTAVLVGRTQGLDVTAEGSGNPGATNVYRVAGARAGLVVFLGDLLKGATATAAGLYVGSRAGSLFGLDDPRGRLLALACGITAVIGHCFPATRRFRGGKGVATAGGVLLVMEPVIALAAALGWVLVARVGGKASLASLLTVVLVPVALVALGRTKEELFGMGVLALIILARHTDNITRLLRGEERSLREPAA